VAFVQSIVRLTLLGSMALVPLIVGLVSARTVDLFGYPYRIDGTRVVMLAGGVIAAAVGMLAYRQMDDRRTEPLLPDLLAALRRGVRRSGSGMLIAVEGATPGETAEQARRLVEALRERGQRVVLAGPAQLRAEPGVGVPVSGVRASALAEAAVRADLVERVVRPALDDGATVVADRFLASPLVRFGVAADRAQSELDGSELESLTSFATGRLRPDVSVLLDRAPTQSPAEAAVPAGDDTAPIALPGEEHLRVRRLLTRMAAAEPHRYVVVAADGPPDDVAARVLAALTPMLPVSPTAEGEPPGRSEGLATAGIRPTTSEVAADRRYEPGSSGADAVTVGVGHGEPRARSVGDQPGATATTAVVDDAEIASTGAEAAPLRLRHLRRRS
jgi:dTMP kinase